MDLIYLGYFQLWLSLLSAEKSENSDPINTPLINSWLDMLQEGKVMSVWCGYEQGGVVLVVLRIRTCVFTLIVMRYSAKFDLIWFGVLNFEYCSRLDCLFRHHGSGLEQLEVQDCLLRHQGE